MLLIFHFIQLYTAIHKQRVMKMDNVVLKSSQRVFLSFSSFLTSSAKGLVSLAAVFSIVTQRSLRDDTKNGCEGDYKRLENGTFASRLDHESAVAAHVSSTCKPALTMPHLSHPHITEVLHRPIKLRQLVVSRSCSQSVLIVLTKEPIQTVDTQKKNSIFFFFKSSKLVN